jgi:hypothetical protein
MRLKLDRLQVWVEILPAKLTAIMKPRHCCLFLFSFHFPVISSSDCIDQSKTFRDRPFLGLTLHALYTPPRGLTFARIIWSDHMPAEQSDHQNPSHPKPSVPIRSHQFPSEAISSHPKPSVPIRSHQFPSEAISTHQNPGYSLRNNGDSCKW